ncbi:hypothetical protein C7E18_05090, partial [Stenotrophomonas maltophilia]
TDGPLRVTPDEAGATRLRRFRATGPFRRTELTPPRPGWSKSNKDGGNDKGGDARPLPPIAGPAESH